MFEGMQLSEINIWPLLAILTTILLTAVGWGIRAVLARVNRLDEKTEHIFAEVISKMDANRNEIRAYLREYVRRETCRAHREAIHKELDDIKAHLKFGRRFGDNIYTDMVRHFNELLKREEDDVIGCKPCTAKENAEDVEEEEVVYVNNVETHETNEANAWKGQNQR